MITLAGLLVLTYLAGWVAWNLSIPSRLTWACLAMLLLTFILTGLTLGVLGNLLTK